LVVRGQQHDPLVALVLRDLAQHLVVGQLDFSAELAQIAAASPDAVFAFMPGGMGVNLVRQYRQLSRFGAQLAPPK
jgi:ABC-type branched-subunit amino acid transport system substrate-binding protein